MDTQQSFDKMLDGLFILIIVGLCAVPLALWKLVEIIIWIVKRVSQ